MEIGKRAIRWVVARRIVIGMALFIVVALAAGCSSEVRRNDIYDFRSGVAELRITDNSVFPREVSNLDYFDARVVLHNLAAYDATNVKVGFAGLDADKIKLEAAEQDMEEFYGRSLTYPDGDRREAVFRGNVARLRLAGDDGRKDKYQVYVSYESVVELAKDICVSGASMVVADGGCTVESVPRGLSGQGAPVVFTNLYSQAVGDRGQIKFTLENRGLGDMVYAVINRASLGGVPISCQFLGPYPARFEFTRKEKTVDVSCSFKLEQGGKSYLSSVYVQMGYGYRLWQEQEVIIRRAGAVVSPIDERLLR